MNSVVLTKGYYQWLKGSDVNLTTNFSTKELECKCSNEDCKTQTISKELIDKAQTVRNDLGPLKITSAYRCSEHNKKIGGASKSQHVLGNALDIKPLKATMSELLNKCRTLFNGIGVNSKFTHVDVRKTKAEWTY
jgi:uncharacterized protein YcbK (DUF882 family)